MNGRIPVSRDTAGLATVVAETLVSMCPNDPILIEQRALTQPPSSFTDERRDAAAYQSWVRDWDTVEGERLLTIRERVGYLPRHPRFLVIPLSPASLKQVPQVHPSLSGQLYPHWELSQSGPSQGIADTYIIPLLADVVLPAYALFEIAATLAVHPDVEMLFSDEDRIDGAGQRRSPWFRSAYDPDLMLGQNATGSLVVYRCDLFLRAGGVRRDLPGDLALYDLALRATATASREGIRHLPAVLCHRRDEPHFDLVEAEPARDLVRAHLGRDASVTPAPRAPRWNRIIYRLPDPPPLVSVIVPTRDQSALLRVCVDAILNRTDYPRFELLIVDNGSMEPATQELLAALSQDQRVRMLTCPGAFNWSAINNTAVMSAHGEVLVFLNNDTDVTDAGWLRELVSQAVRQDIGIVGARLLYPNGQVQHAGMVTAPGGWPLHLYRFAYGSDLGCMGELALTRSCGAVTGACLAMRRDVFEAVAGFENRGLAVTFNDVDLCLRVRAAGRRVICTPFAEMIHHELATRGPDTTEQNQERFKRERDFVLNAWGPAFERDPFCSPNLNFEFDAVRLARPPRHVRPWRNW